MDAPAQSKPPRRWHQRRLLRYLAVLLAGCVVAYYCWDTLFMPDDLRRLQGTWKSVRRFSVINEENEEIKTTHWIVIDGRRITDKGADKGGSDNEASYRLDIIPDRRELRVYEESKIKVFGKPVRLPT